MIKSSFPPAPPHRWDETRPPCAAPLNRRRAGLATCPAINAPQDTQYIRSLPLTGLVKDFTPYVNNPGWDGGLWGRAKPLCRPTPPLTQPAGADGARLTGLTRAGCSNLRRRHVDAPTTLDGCGIWPGQDGRLARYGPIRRWARDRPIRLGLARLVLPCGQALAALGFPVTG